MQAASGGLDAEEGRPLCREEAGARPRMQPVACSRASGGGRAAGSRAPARLSCELPAAAGVPAPAPPPASDWPGTPLPPHHSPTAAHSRARRYPHPPAHPSPQAGRQAGRRRAPTQAASHVLHLRDQLWHVAHRMVQALQAVGDLGRVFHGLVAGDEGALRQARGKDQGRGGVAVAGGCWREWMDGLRGCSSGVTSTAGTREPSGSKHRLLNHHHHHTHTDTNARTHAPTS